MIKEILRHVIHGFGYGSFIYMICIIFFSEQTHVDATNTLTVLVMSGLIGILSMIFDVEQFSYLVALILHFIGTLMITLGAASLTLGLHEVLYAPTFWFSFLTIYVAVWVFIKINLRLKVERVNESIVKFHKRSDQ